MTPPNTKYTTFIEQLLKYGAAYQNQKSQAAFSLFGDSEDAMIPEPAIPTCEPWNLVDKLNKEKEVTGIYISGHPLDDYRMEIENFITCTLDKAEDHTRGGLLKLAGLVVSAQHRVSKNGNGWGIFEMQDYNGGMDFRLFGDDYQKFKHLFETGKVLYIKGKYKKSWQGDRMDFKVEEVNLLEGVGSDMTECITIKVPIERIDKMLIHDIESLCDRYKGKHQLKMIFLDHSNKTSLTFKSLSNKVNVTNDFINAVDKIGLEYKLN